MSDVEIEVRIVRDEPTDRAILVQETLTSRKVWLPRSEIIEIEYVSRSTLTNPIALVTIPEWLAIEKGLI